MVGDHSKDKVELSSFPTFFISISAQKNVTACLNKGIWNHNILFKSFLDKLKGKGDVFIKVTGLYFLSTFKF